MFSASCTGTVIGGHKLYLHMFTLYNVDGCSKQIVIFQLSGTISRGTITRGTISRGAILANVLDSNSIGAPRFSDFKKQCSRTYHL